MSGYKRVNFYELCRLCATNQQKEKTHIFTEEGRKIQLQNKIQSCLSLTVCESDFLPKVVCSRCLRSLEVCYSFRQECVTSESMLSSYFKNFRYTEDFKKSGKVYIKDTTIKHNTESVTSSSTNNVPSTITTNYNNTPIVEPKPQPITQQSQQMETIPFYTLQLPTIVTNQQTIEKPKPDLNQSKIIQAPVTQPQVSYNLNTINLAALKTAVQGTTPKLNETLSNVVVNANGEVINIAQLVDFESLINHSQMPKTTTNNSVLKSQKFKKIKENKEIIADESIIKIDLTDTEQNAYDTGQAHIKYDKLPHIKSTHNTKYTYTIKVDEPKANIHSTVIFNPLTDFQPQNNATNNNNSINFSNYQNSNVYTNPGINIVTTSNNTNTLVTNSNICNTAHLETSTVNLNALNPDVNSPQNYSRNNYTNVISSIPSITPQNNTPKTTTNVALNNIHISVPNENVNNNVTINNSQSQSSTNIINNQQTNQKIHACDICHKTFKRKEHLYQHIKLHTGFRPYSCDSCNKSFMRKEHLLRHMTSHSGQKNFTCNICEKSFSRNDNLLKHKKTHDKQSSYTCEVCNKQFVMKHYYLAHKITHDDEKCNINQLWGVLKA